MEYIEQKQLLANNQLINFIQFNPQFQEKLLFIHGNFSSWVWWIDVIQMLLKYTKKYHIIAIDQRGFGKSTYNNPVTSFDGHAKDIIEFCQMKNLKNVVLCGWSYGGGIAMKAAELNGQLFSKIILAASVCHKGLVMYNQQGQQCKSRQQIIKLPKIQFAQSILTTKNFQLQKSIYNAVLFPKMLTYPQQKKTKLINSSFQQKQYLDVLTALANSDINIQNIKKKVLILHGKDDLVIKSQTVEETGKLIKDCVMEIWEDKGHMLPIEDVGRFVDRILKFIDKNQ